MKKYNIKQCESHFLVWLGFFWFGFGLIFSILWFKMKWNLWDPDNCFNAEINKWQSSKIPSAQKLSINLQTIFPRRLLFSYLLLVLHIWSRKLDIVLPVSPVTDKANLHENSPETTQRPDKSTSQCKITGSVLTKVNRKCKFYFCLTITSLTRQELSKNTLN